MSSTDIPETRRQTAEGEPDLRQIIGVLWEGKWIIGVPTLIFALVSIFVSLALPNVYRAEALVAPNEQQSAGGLSGALAQYGGLANLAGISLPVGSSKKTEFGIEVLRSRQFIAEFIDRRGLLVPLMAGKGWDVSTGDLLIDKETFDTKNRVWLRDAKPPRRAEPSAQEAYKVFIEAMNISQDKKTGFITLSIEHYSPVLAAQWANALVADINRTVMERDVASAEESIAYLRNEIEQTSLAELRNVFFRLIEEQTKTVMLARTSPEYLFRTIDPAVVPELKAKPKRSVIVVAATMLGGFIGVLLVMLRKSFSQRRV